METALFTDPAGEKLRSHYTLHGSKQALDAFFERPDLVLAHQRLYDEVLAVEFPQGTRYHLDLSLPDRRNITPRLTILPRPIGPFDMDRFQKARACFDTETLFGHMRDRMTRLDDIISPVRETDPVITVRRTHCDGCLTTDRRLVSAMDRAAIEASHACDETCFICHHHRRSRIVCRGFYDANPQIHDRVNIVDPDQEKGMPA